MFSCEGVIPRLELLFNEMNFRSENFATVLCFKRVGVVFVSEQISLRLTFSALLTLGGILMVILGRNAKNRKTSQPR